MPCLNSSNNPEIEELPLRSNNNRSTYFLHTMYLVPLLERCREVLFFFAGVFVYSISERFYMHLD